MAFDQIAKSSTAAKTTEVTQVFASGSALTGVFVAGTQSDFSAQAARAIYVPTQSEARNRFLRSWARKNMRRMLTGVGGLALILPTAMMASAQEQGPVDVRTIDGVVGAEVAPNGELILTLDTGEQIRIAQEGYIVSPDGSILVAASTADAIALAGVAETGGAAASGGGIAAAIGGLAAAGAAAGGGGSSGGDAPATPTLAFVVDGYLSGATVIGDADGNNAFSDGETTTITASDGSFDPSLFADDVPLVTTGGIDISTGEAFTGTLKAPAGSTVITPLTTMVQALVEADTSETPITPEAAAAQLSSALGLTGADLLNDDPAALANEGDLSQLQAAAQIAAVVNLVTAAASEGEEGAAVDAVLTALAADLTDGGEGNPLTDATAIEAALAAAGTSIQVSTSDLAQALASSATQIGNATDLETLEGTQAVVQGTLTQAVEESVGDTEGETALSTANGNTELFENAAPFRPVLDASLAGTSNELNAADTSITVFGTGQIGSTVTVALGGVSQSAAVDAQGNWSVTFAGANFPADGDASTVITASKTVAGETVTSGAATGVATFSIDSGVPAAPTVDAVTGDNLVDGDDLTAGVEITGTAEAGSTVTVLIDGSEAGTATATDGTWALALPQLVDGTYTVSATATDAAQNTSPASAGVQFQILTTEPAATVDPLAAGPVVDGTEAASPLAVSGTFGNAESVQVRLLDGTTEIATQTATLDTDAGTWSAAFDLSGVADGNYTIEAVATDSSGAASPAATAGFELDAIQPAPPAILAIAGDNVVDASELANGVTITGTVEPGSVVTVSVGDTEIGSVTSTDGTWSVDFPGDLAPGDYTITAAATDGEGNTLQPASASVTIPDETAPAAPVISAIAGDDTVDATELSAGVTVAGTAEAGSTVTVSLGDTEIGSVTATGGTWSVDLPAGLSDAEYTISAVATDPAGNASTAATRTFTVDALPPSVITLEEGESEGDLVLYDSVELAILAEAEEDSEGTGNVSNVPAGTPVTITITGTTTTGPFNLSYNFVTDENGDFQIEIPDADIIALDGMTEAGDIRISAGSAELNLKVIVNSTLFDGQSPTFVVGDFVVDPIADTAAATGADVDNIEVSDGAFLGGGLVGVATWVMGPTPDDLDYQTLLVYDGTSNAPIRTFALDGGAGPDVAPLTSQFYFDDANNDVYVAQLGVSGDLNVPEITHDPNQLINIYRIPGASLLDAIPTDPSATNLDFTATGVEVSSITLGDLDPTWDGSPLPLNEVYIPFDITGPEGSPVQLVFRENLETGLVSEAYMLQFDPVSGNSVARELDVAPLLFTDGTVDDFLIEQSIQRDPSGNPERIELAAPDQGDGIDRFARFDYVNDILSAVQVGTDDQTDVMIAEGGILEFLDGGDRSDFRVETDNDVFLVGNTVGDEGALNITENNGSITVSVDRDAFLEFFDGATTVPGFAFDVFWFSETDAEPTSYSIEGFASESAALQRTTSPEGFAVARFTVDLDVTGFANDPSATTFDLVTLAAPDMVAGGVYAFGFNTIDGESADVNTTPPVFDGFVKSAGVDGSNVQFIVTSDTGGSNGQDLATGFQVGAGGDVVQIFADFNAYAGTGVERIAEGATGVTLAPDTGVVIFDGLTSGEDADVIALVDTALTGLASESIIAVTADDSGIFVWQIRFDGAGTASTDSFLRLDGINDMDIGSFTSSNIDLFQPPLV